MPQSLLVLNVAVENYSSSISGATIPHLSEFEPASWTDTVKLNILWTFAPSEQMTWGELSDLSEHPFPLPKNQM